MLLLLLAITAPAVAQKQGEIPATQAPEPSVAAAGPQLRAVNGYGFGGLVCSSEKEDTIAVANDGDAMLTVTPSLFGGNQADFTLLAPYNAPFTVKPHDSVRVRIRFAPSAYGAKTTTLRLVNNDTRPGMNPWDIMLTASWLRSDATISGTELDFGEICVNAAKQLSVTVNYTGDVDDKLNGVPKIMGANGAHFSVVQPTTSTLGLKAPSDRKTIVVQFNPQVAGVFVDSIRISVGQCVIPFTVTLRGSAVDMRPKLYNTADSIDFGQQAVGSPGKSVPVKIQNFGSSKITVESVFITPPGVGTEFQLPSSMTGTPLNPAGIASGTLTFKPTQIGLIEGAELGIVLTQGGCIDTIFIKLRAEGVAPVLALSRTHLDFIADSCSEVATVLYDTVYLHNRGTLPANVRSVISTNVPRVNVRLNPALATRIDPGDSVGVVVEIRPGQPGAPTAQILIATDDPDPDRDTMTIDIVMKLESTVIKLLLGDGSVAPAAIDFGISFGCAPKLDTFMLRNAGTLDAVVNGGFSQGTAFRLMPKPPYAVDGNKDTALLVIFDPPATGLYRDTLTLQNGTCADQVISVAVAGRRYDLTYDIAGIDFGQSNIGASRAGSASLTNTSATPADVKVRVVDAFVRPAGTPFTLAPGTFPADLAPGEQLASTVLFQPTAEVPYDAQLCYVTETPCSDTICVPLHGVGIQSDIFVARTDLNFGPRYTCQGDSTLFLAIANIGTKPLSLLDLTILPGPDAAAFTQSTPISFPRQIPPSDSAVVAYTFSPSAVAADGPASATLRIVSDDFKQDTIEVSLRGRRRSYSMSAPALVDFGQVLLTLTQRKSVTLKNTSPDTIRIDKMTIVPPFSIVGTPPDVIPPFDSVLVDLEFAPTDTLVHHDTLFVSYGGVCLEVTKVALDGEGRPPLTGFAEITVPKDLTGKPGDNVSIPLVLHRSNLIDVVGATTFQAVVRFNGSMLEPLNARARLEPFVKGVAGAKVSSGRIVSTQKDGEDMLVTVEIANDPIPDAPDTLGFLDASVLLGNAVTTPVSIDTVRWLDGLMNTESVQGNFTLSGYCDVGGNRILRVSGAFGIKSATPNPFNPSTEIIFETAEAGPTSLVIHDITGRRVATLVDNESLRVQAHRYVWDASAFPSGLYYAELITPTQRSLFRLWYIK